MPGVCPRCNREVYFAEERLALGKVWHAFCFSCRNCRKLLDSCTVATYCGELFCKNCYVRLFPPTANNKIKTIPRPTQFASLNYSKCRVDNQNGDISFNREKHSRFDKYRLRGGGTEEKETNICLEEEGNHSLEAESTSAGIVNSIITICNPSFGPSAVTACTQNTECQNSGAGKACLIKSEKSVFGGSNEHCYRLHRAQQREADQSETNLNVGSELDYDTSITEAHLSTDNTTIPSRRKFTYPPIPPPRSPLPSRRRVSFCDVVFGDRCGNRRNSNTEMQDNHHRPCCNNDGNEEYGTSYDIWQADDAAGKSDGGYENTFEANHIEDKTEPRMKFGRDDSDSHNGTETTMNNSDEIDKNREQDRSIENTTEPLANRTVHARDADDSPSKENISSYVYENAQNSLDGCDDKERMRGGCGGSRCGIKGTGNPCDHCVKGNDYFANCRPRTICSQGRNVDENYDFCPPRELDSLIVPATCTVCSPPCADRHGCCPLANDPPVCKKAITRCRQPCTGQSQACGSGGCCGSGCRGGCGKPGQTCIPARPCTTPPCRPHSPSVGSPCSPPRACLPQPPCCRARKTSVCAPVVVGECSVPGGGENYGRNCGNCCGGGGGTSYCRSRSPGCRPKGCRRCCSNDGARSTDGGGCRPRLLGCECLGGGLDCQRCGRKVYQAEMQIASGVPYHNICFSCFCCRKPLEPLTYQENCGEIYCKQCYVRNFGPQGYGYGVGAGALQTPM